MVGRCSEEVGADSQDYILNMDQTAVYYSMQAKRTLSKQGQRTIFIRKAKDDSKRATAAFTITASGLQLQPCIVFKGAYIFIKQREVPTNNSFSLQVSQMHELRGASLLHHQLHLEDHCISANRMHGWTRELCSGGLLQC